MVLQVNELVAFFSLGIAALMRFKYEGRMCSGDIEEFWFEAELESRGNFIFVMGIFLIAYFVAQVIIHFVLGCLAKHVY